MSELLWEIGCEELPATFVAPTLVQIETLFRAKFGTARLMGEEVTVRTYGTPRRLVLHVTGLESRQPDETVTVKGPAQNVAFDSEGQPTRAALGFAQKNGIAGDGLVLVDGYVQATVTRIGRPTIELAAEMLPKVARELTFPKAMRWGAGKLRFARPIRWIVALLASEIIPFSIEHIATGRTTRGHRFLSPDPIDIPHAKDYFSIMHEKSVLIDPASRREIIVSQSEALGRETGGTVQIAEELLDENVFLTEYPTAVRGAFDPAYLALPRAVLVTAMRKHQRYFPISGTDGKLMPGFIAIRNGGDQYLDTVRAGFENVLAARFADAKFFFDLDTQSPLSARIDDTKLIVFQEKLGSVHEKSLRLTQILQNGGLLDEQNEAEARDILRAATLCKADLASEMVKELPSLQGIVGEEYARRDGESESVSRAIAEHYQPKGAGDPLPVSPAGRLLAIADRVDTLAGYVGIGIVPTGTSDPYALRRAAAGLVALLATSPKFPKFPKLFDAAWGAYIEQGIALTEAQETAAQSFKNLIGQRLDAALEEKRVRYDVRDAILHSLRWDSIFPTEARALALNSAIDGEDAAQALAAATRIGNILRFARKENVSLTLTEPNPALYEHHAEGDLWQDYLSRSVLYEEQLAQGEWQAALHTLAALRPAVDTFFDAVMVMAGDSAIRDNRLSILVRIQDLFMRYADFERIVIG